MAEAKQLELVDARKLKQSMWEYRHLFTGQAQWKCSVCRDANNKRTTALICTDVQEYIFTVGEGKEAKLNRGWCVRGICPQCMNEATTPLKDEYTPSYCDGETMNKVWHHKLRPSWLIPPQEWQDCGAPLYPLVDEDAVGPISLSLKNIRDRVIETKRRYDPSYVADTHRKPILSPEMADDIPSTLNVSTGKIIEPTEAPDDNAEIYAIYDPWA